MAVVWYSKFVEGIKRDMRSREPNGYGRDDPEGMERAEQVRDTGLLKTGRMRKVGLLLEPSRVARYEREYIQEKINSWDVWK